MRTVRTLRAAGLFLAAFTSAALAAAPDDIALAPPPDAPAPVAGPGYALDTEILVRDWVLCVSASGAAELARARMQGAEPGRAAYASLADARACGKFPELRVILRERLHDDGAGSHRDAQAFSALINFSGEWASAFVVSGATSNE